MNTQAPGQICPESTEAIRSQFEQWFYTKDDSCTPSFLKSIRLYDGYYCPSISVASLNWAWIGWRAAIERMEGAK